MTNDQKYKTVEERVKEFHKFICKRCGRGICEKCEVHTLCNELGYYGKFAGWLALEAEEEEEEEKPEPCPFCGKAVTESMTVAGGVFIDCKCGYRSEVSVGGTPHELKIKAIAAHNRVCRAVEAAKKGATNA